MPRWSPIRYPCGTCRPSQRLEYVRPARCAACEIGTFREHYGPARHPQLARSKMVVQLSSLGIVIHSS